jgi:hypothetical protein
MQDLFGAEGLLCCLGLVWALYDLSKRIIEKLKGPRWVRMTIRAGLVSARFETGSD